MIIFGRPFPQIFIPEKRVEEGKGKRERKKRKKKRKKEKERERKGEKRKRREVERGGRKRNKKENLEANVRFSFSHLSILDNAAYCYR